MSNTVSSPTVLLISVPSRQTKLKVIRLEFHYRRLHFHFKLNKLFQMILHNWVIWYM